MMRLRYYILDRLWIILFYHATKTSDIRVLKPRVSNHGKPLVYFSTKRENVLVYLCNAIEKYCNSIRFDYDGIYQKWGSYGFNKDGILQIDEYYPNATYDTYKGEEGYVYSVKYIENYCEQEDIPYAITSECEISIDDCEYVPDAYEAMQKAIANGDIVFREYANNSPAMIEWIEKTIKAEYENASQHPEYRQFLKAKFSFL